jgi:hypothetical protein
MQFVHDILRDRILASAGIVSCSLICPALSYEELATTQWSPFFERLMRNRLILGAFRYGPLGASGKPAWDRMRSVRSRLASYELTGNKEMLVDVANLMLCEFVECAHPTAHFQPLDGGHHCVS